MPLSQKKSHKLKIKPYYDYTTYFTLILMIIYGYVWEVFLDPIREGSLLWIKVLPLIFCLPGIFRKNIRVLQWLSLFVWFYVCEALVRITSDPTDKIFYSIIWLLLSLSLTISTWFVIRNKRNSKL